MKTKSKDRIKLPDGSVTTLGEALDAGVLVVLESRYYDPPRYFARTRDEFFGGENAVSWEIGKTLFLSRTGQRPF